MENKFPYIWQIKDGFPAKGIEKHSCKVFGAFICGGGSTMGYKLAGFNHLGGIEIDKQIAEVYQNNHHPKYLYREDIKNFPNRTDIPEELLNLDILDGSPPCSTFSISGSREDSWGKEKLFREGQAIQRLDDLFFDYIKLAEILKPKVIIAENVVGLIQGNAKAYVQEIIKEFKRIGYQVQLFKLNAASMGVPQRRERVFFICRKESLNWPDLILNFNFPKILFREIENNVTTSIGEKISNAYYKWWVLCKPGNSLSTVHPKGSFFNSYKVWKNDVLPTITATVAGKTLHYSVPAEISDEALILCGTFPIDFQFGDVQPGYLIGMSVPPVMMAQISYQIYCQWFNCHDTKFAA